MNENTSIDSRVIIEPLESLVRAIANKVDREWPARFRDIIGARELFLLTVKTADVTSRSIRYLCADTPPDPDRRLEYSLSVPPLNRTILDNLFTVIFVLENLPERCRWYFRADWREHALELRRYTAAYGNDPDWQEWLQRLAEYVNTGATLAGISTGEMSNPASIPRWPNPGGMVNYGVSSKSPLPPRRSFLKYLNDWFYADASQQSHLGSGGLGKRAGVLLRDRSDPEIENRMKSFKRTQVGQTITLMLALASELEAGFEFGLRAKIQYLWGVTLPYVAVAKEMYSKRYETLFVA